jgi:glycosyltransferase involved in cell wall biosynthesis
MACYGPARHEKGSDLLVRGIVRYLEKHPEGETRFVLQWLEDFVGADGETVSLPDSLKKHPRVEIVDRFFAEGEYADRLAATQILLLPYRGSSYGLRVSRVVIEALVNGIPVVATRGTTLARQAQEHGVALHCEDEDVESLVAAIEEMEHHCEGGTVAASGRKALAQEHFSVSHFRQLL